MVIIKCYPLSCISIGCTHSPSVVSLWPTETTQHAPLNLQPVVIKGWTQSATILWRLNNAQLVLRGPKCAKKISPTPLHHHQPYPIKQVKMDPCFHVVYAKFWHYHLNGAAEIIRLIRPGNIFPISYCPILESCGHCHPTFLFSADRSDTLCGLRCVCVWGRGGGCT